MTEIADLCKDDIFLQFCNYVTAHHRAFYIIGLEPKEKNEVEKIVVSSIRALI